MRNDKESGNDKDSGNDNHLKGTDLIRVVINDDGVGDWEGDHRPHLTGFGQSDLAAILELAEDL